MQICLCHLNVAIDLPGLPQIPAPVTDQSCAATSSANTLIGVGCPHAPPSCANLYSARRSRRHRLPFPAGSFIEGFRTPATVQAASLRSAGIRNPQQTQNCLPALVRSPSENRPGPRLAGRRLWAIGRHAARFGDQINMDEVFGTHRRRPQRRPVAQGRAMSNGCTFAPPAIRGFDGSKCSCSSRFRTSARAATKASLRLLACRSATLKKASPK